MANADPTTMERHLWTGQSPAALAWVMAVLGPLSVLAVLGFAIAGRPTAFSVIVFPPSWAPTAALNAVALSGGRIIDTRLGGTLVVAAAENDGFAELARANGAVLVLPFASPAGCMTLTNKHNLQRGPR